MAVRMIRRLTANSARLGGCALLLAVLCAVAPPAALAQTLDRIQSSGALRIGYVGGQEPFASSENGAAPTGYAIDMCRQVAAEIGRRVAGLKVEYIQTPLADAFGAIADGRIDMVCGAISATLARRETVDFSEPLFVTGVSGLLRRDSPRDLRELFMGVRDVSPPRSPELRPFAKEVVGVRVSTATESALRAAVLAGGYEVQIVTFASHAMGLSALEARQIDAYFADRALLSALLAKAGDPARLIVGSRLFTRELYAIALKRGDSDFRLLIDRVLTRYYQTREFSGLLASYFGADGNNLAALILAQAVPE